MRIVFSLMPRVGVSLHVNDLFNGAF